MHRRSTRFVLVLLAVCSLALASRSHAQAPEHSVARRWTDLLLASIRRDFGRPTIHARNLFHMSVAMWDAWAAFDDRAHPWVSSERHVAADREAARREAISHAAYRVLLNRFATSPGFATMQPQYVALMQELGFDPSNASTLGDSPAEIGRAHV